MPMLDYEKPVQTRDGRAARIIDTNIQKEHGVYLAVVVSSMDGKTDNILLYYPDGRFQKGRSDNMDLVNVPSKCWVNFYPKGSFDVYRTHTHAKSMRFANCLLTHCFDGIEAEVLLSMLNDLGAQCNG